jgi:hypothetical protein
MTSRSDESANEPVRQWQVSPSGTVIVQNYTGEMSPVEAYTRAPTQLLYLAGCAAIRGASTHFTLHEFIGVQKGALLNDNATP